MQGAPRHGIKVPEVTLAFWAVKVCATTLGETGGDAVSMSMGLGYLYSTALFAVLFLAAAAAQIAARRFTSWLFWTTVLASTMVGTTLADFADRSLGIGYAGGAATLAALLVAALAWWRAALGSVAVDAIATPRAEVHYWLTILCAQTLGTALGDWFADDAGLGYGGSALLFGGALLALAALYRHTACSRTVLFWSAFVLTRPLGAVLGDLLDKPLAAGGLALDRYAATAVLLGMIVLLLWRYPSRAATTGH